MSDYDSVSAYREAWQKKDLQDEIQRLQSELTAARDENKRLLAANRDLQHWFGDVRDEAERLRARVEDAFCEGYKAAPTGLTKTNRVGMHVRVAAKDYAQRIRQQGGEGER